MGGLFSPILVASPGGTLAYMGRVPCFYMEAPFEMEHEGHIIPFSPSPGTKP